MLFRITTLSSIVGYMFSHILCGNVPLDKFATLKFFFSLVNAIKQFVPCLGQTRN